MNYSTKNIWIITCVFMLCAAFVAFDAVPAMAGFVDNFSSVTAEFQKTMEWASTGTLGKLILVGALIMAFVMGLFMGKVGAAVRVGGFGILLSLVFKIANSLQGFGK